MRDPFFVVTTGRSGSLSLSLSLSQHPLVCCLHEPWRYLIELSYKRLAGLAPGAGSAVDMFRRMVPVPAGVQVCGIVDQKLSAFIPDLAEAFPGARFVWLVRDGRSVVASGYERGWYVDGEEGNLANPWARWRWRGPEVVSPSGDAMDPGRWEELGPFGRNCWYWAWVNRMIWDELGKIGRERGRLVRLEDLGVGDVVQLQEWLGLAPVELDVVHTNKGPGRLRWSTWDEGQRAVFADVCGTVMETLGYGEIDGFSLSRE